MTPENRAGSEDGEPSTSHWLTEALEAEASQHTPDTRRIRAAMRERTGTVCAARLKRRWRLAGVPAGLVAGALCAVMVFVVSTAYHGGRSQTSPSPGPLAGTSQTTGVRAHIVSATGTVDASSRTGWSQEDVAIDFTRPIAGFQLSVKVSLGSTGASAGYSSTYDSSLFDVTVDTQAHALVYKFNLKPGKTLPPGSSRFDVRFSYGNPHNPAHDTYYVSVFTDKAHGRVADVAQGAF